MHTVTERGSTHGESSGLQSLTFFWIINFEYLTRLHNGATLRHVNYSRELVRGGHKVLLGVRFEPQYQEQSREWFAALRDEGVISDFFELSYAPAPAYLRLSALTPFPSVENFVLRKFQLATVGSVEELICRHNVDVVLLSDRHFVFLATRLGAGVPVVIDFCDCASLFFWRELRNLARNHNFWPMLRTFRRLLSVFGEDRYYTRRGRPIIVVSPVDQRALERIGGKRSQVLTLLNGVSVALGEPSMEKAKNRIIFSGNMDFSPNYTAALWFLDHVFPLVLKHIPDAQFVVAGANPPPFLQERASGNVFITGYVEDLNKEIARSALYVVPMISGGGFKNKVAEAAVNRTYIVATSIAVEFLDPATRELVAVADSAEEMAESIGLLLRHPEGCESRLSTLHDHISRTFTWSRRAQELSEIARACIADTRGSTRHPESNRSGSILQQ